jgi:uncharacterized protein involved in response to NO
MHFKFSEDALGHYFFSQPHQPFFLLAFVNALFGMLIFMLSYQGIIHLDIDPQHFHGYSMLYLIFTPAFTAFLFTTFPRFSSTPPIEKEIYFRIFSLYYIGAILFILGSIVSVILSCFAMAILLVAHSMIFSILKNIYSQTTMPDTHDLFWILSAMGFGFLSHILYFAGSLFYTPLIGFATQTGIYLYLFLLTFSVAQRMVPFFSHCHYIRDDRFMKRVAILLGIHVLLETLFRHSSFAVDILLAFYIGREILRWELPFPNPNPMLWILHLALYWIPVAFIFAAMSNLTAMISGATFLSLDIHVLMLGFVFTILIGFGTRVTIGHSGNMMQATLWEKVLFNWTQVVVVMRLFVSVAAAFGWDFIVLFDISAIVWLIMFILWAVRFFTVLINGKKLHS